MCELKACGDEICCRNRRRSGWSGGIRRLHLTEGTDMVQAFDSFNKDGLIAALEGVARGRGRGRGCVRACGRGHG